MTSRTTGERADKLEKQNQTDPLGAKRVYIHAKTGKNFLSTMKNAGV